MRPILLALLLVLGSLSVPAAQAARVYEEGGATCIHVNEVRECPVPVAVEHRPGTEEVCWTGTSYDEWFCYSTVLATLGPDGACVVALGAGECVQAVPEGACWVSYGRPHCVGAREDDGWTCAAWWPAGDACALARRDSGWACVGGRAYAAGAAGTCATASATVDGYCYGSSPGWTPPEEGPTCDPLPPTAGVEGNCYQINGRGPNCVHVEDGCVGMSHGGAPPTYFVCAEPWLRTVDAFACGRFVSAGVCLSRCSDEQIVVACPLHAHECLLTVHLVVDCMRVGDVRQVHEPARPSGAA